MGTISIDPIGIEAGDANFYRYVNNSPTNASDPSGLAEQSSRPWWMPDRLILSAGRKLKQLLKPVSDALNTPIPRPVPRGAEHMPGLLFPPHYAQERFEAGDPRYTETVGEALADTRKTAVELAVVLTPVPILTQRTIRVSRQAVVGPAGAMFGPKSVGAAQVPASNGGRLVHLTNAEAGATINRSSTLVGDIYAGPLSNAQASGLGVTARTGLSPSAFEVAVPIPEVAQGAFSTVTPIGPITAWQRATGQQFTARGVLNLHSGEFVRQGVNLNQAGIYVIDAGITGGTIVVGGNLLIRGGSDE